ncbi:hypothetical protein ACFS5L_05210 [Streptomyces phyllanthi]|uniref:hypothetical protein n=1 Tax=Streptomyces phyllanthi TaxID=1803180 RepID=UPI0018836084|nr:hypothetical protein [Streptomyces phyllanthi]
MTASTVSAQDARPVQSGAPGADTRTAGAAADRAVGHHAVHLDAFGTRLELPPPEQLAFLGGVGALVCLEILEWPVALVLAVGHQLAHSHHGRVLREFGEALEEA